VEVIPLRGLFSIIMKTICLENGVGVALAMEIVPTDNMTRSIITTVRIANALFLPQSLRPFKCTSLCNPSL